MRLFKDDIATIDKVQRALKQIVQQALNDYLSATQKSDRALTQGASEPLPSPFGGPSKDTP
jgi:hypothetical protein